MADYTPQVNLALRLIKAKGSQATVEKETGSTYDPDTGTNTPVYSTSTAYAVTFNYDLKFVADGLVQSNDIQCLMENTASPEQGDFVTIGGTKYTVISARPEKPDGVTTIFHDLQLRV